MLEYLNGILVSHQENILVLDVNGLGYKVSISTKTRLKLPGLTQKLHLFVSMIIREDAHTLYGFLTILERDVFEILISLSGIGPKTALNILSSFELFHLKEIVEKEDIPSLICVPGIGKKTAERMLIDLRGRLSHIVSEEPICANKLDALKALTHLGYSQSIAEKVLKQAMESLSSTCDLPTLIATALKIRI